MAQRDLLHAGTVPMDPGQRDRAVTIQQLTEGVDASGAPTETWTTLVTPVWMRKRDLRQDERFKASQLSAPVETMWEMPYRTDMDPESVDVPKTRRLLYQQRTYDIVGASQIGRREGIELMTLAGSKVA